MYVITRPYDGISLNSEREVLRKGKRILKFKTKKQAIKFLEKAGLSLEFTNVDKEIKP